MKLSKNFENDKIEIIKKRLFFRQLRLFIPKNNKNKAKKEKCFKFLLP
jgi:hypothetical protein